MKPRHLIGLFTLTIAVACGGKAVIDGAPGTGGSVADDDGAGANSAGAMGSGANGAGGAGDVSVSVGPVTTSANVTTGGGVGPENTEAACTDDFDNDQDGFVDCEDFDCGDTEACGNF